MSLIKPEQIQKYIDHGFSVFPVQLTDNGEKVEKKPVVEWTDYQKRYASEEEIKVWCSLLDFNALGMATGKISGVTVLDIDDPSIKEYDSTVKVKTISGGYHLWYNYKPGMRNAAKVGNKLIDIRGDGGFVVVPPAKLSEKKKYTWIKSDFDKMGDFPLVVQNKKEFKPTMTTLPEVHSGSRNQTAIQVAGHMVSMTDKKAWETTAWTAFESWNEKHVSPPLDHFELRRTFDSACSMESSKNRKEEKEVKILTGSQIMTNYSALVKKWGNGLSTGYPIVDDYFTFLPEQIYMLSAPTHHGKTSVALNFASRVASMQSNVIFCSLEQGLFVAPRIEASIGAIPETLSILTSHQLVDVKTLVDVVAQRPEQTDLMVIDHLHFMDKNTRNGVTNAIEQMMIDLQNAAKEMQIPILVVSHLRKLNEDRQPTLDDLKDSSALSQVPSVVIQLYAKKQEDGVTHQDWGSFLIRKNRVTGKLGRLCYKIHNSGEVEIDKYRSQKITI
jgi:hypothetical protein